MTLQTMQGAALTPLQEAMLVASLREPRLGLYTQQLEVELREPVDGDRMRAAWQACVARHDVLRLRLDIDARGRSAQQLVPSFEVDVCIDTWDAPDLDDAERRWRSFLAEDRARAFERGAPPHRVQMIRVSPGVWRLLVTFHHALMDGRGHTLLLEELLARYDGLPVQTAASSFVEHAAWIAEQPEGLSREFWSQLLETSAGGSAPPLVGLPGCSEMERCAIVELKALNARQARRLEARAAELGVTPNTLVQAAWAFVLARHADCDDVCFGITRACRHGGPGDPSRTIGLLANTTPFRVPVLLDARIEDWVREIRARHVAQRPHERTPLAAIPRLAGLAADAQLARTVLVFEHYRLDEQIRGLHESWRDRRVRLHERTEGYTVAAYLGDELTLTLDPGSEGVTPDDAHATLERMACVLRSLLDPVNERVGQLALTDAAARESILAQGRAEPSPPHPLFYDQVLGRAEEAPDAIAIESGDETITYAALIERSERLAARMAAAGLERGRPVGLFLERGPDFPVAVLAAFRAGGWYVAFDPADPLPRLEMLFGEASVDLVVTRKALLPNMPSEHAPLLLIDETESRAPEPLPRIELAPDDYSYALFTSGSTGRPKAAINTQRGLANLATVLKVSVGVTSDDRVPLVSTPSFDASVLELAMALPAGGTIVTGRYDELRPGPELARFYEERRATTTFLTPTLLAMLGDAELPDLRLLLAGGEAVPQEIVDRWAPGRRMIDVCGPTEASAIWTTDELHAGEPPTIGRPLPGLEAHVVDERGRPLPHGVPGELWLVGRGVGAGYLNRPERSAESFVPLPWSPDSEERAYRTGDRVRRLADGRIDYLGRRDHQVQLAGLRVELGEIESTLARLEGITRVWVSVVDKKGAMPALVAHADWDSDDDAAITSSQRAARDTLPKHMVPALWDRVVDPPRTPSGKIDRPALAKRAASLLDSEPETRLSPEERERVLVAWNATEVPFDDTPIVKRLEERATRTPDLPALRDATRELTFAALDETATRLAARLSEEGVHDGNLVVLRAPASVELAVAQLATWKCGAAWIPVDPAHPEARLRQIVEESGATRVLDPVPTLAEISSYAPRRAPKTTVDAGSAAYVIYTSGSTGRPKGVVVEQRSLANLCAHYAHALDLDEGSVSSALAGPAFDASVADVWPYLLAGGSVIFPDPELKTDLEGLARWLAGSGITHSFVPTALAELLMARSWEDAGRLRVLLTGGEALKRLPGHPLPFRVLNTYGPTECTVDAVWAEIDPAGDDLPPPIGRPILNTRAYVVGSEGQVLGIGERGELLLAGASVARGYLHRDELTRGAFVDPGIPEEPDARAYRTGDLVSWREDGQLAFHGRVDRQVQVRGVRVELGEIESVLGSLKGVAQAAVEALEDEARNVGLVAWIAPAGSRVLQAEALRDALRARLPEAMVPRDIELRERLPLTPNGKVDRARLRAELTQSTGRSSTGPDPHPRLEGLAGEILALWQDVLERPTLSADDDFFDHGGDSLSAVRMLLALEERLGLDAAFPVLVQNPTARRFAAALAPRGRDRENLRGDSLLVTLREAESARAEIVFIPGAGGGVHWFRDVASHLDDDVRARAFETLGLGAEGAASIEAMAERVCAALETSKPRAPIVLAGYSVGGLIAYEAATRCRAERVALIESWVISAQHGGLVRDLARMGAHFLRLDGRAKRRFVADKLTFVREQLTRQRTISRGRHAASEDAESAVDLKGLHLDAARRYRPPSSAIPLTLICSESPPATAPRDPAAAWRACTTAEVSFCQAPGDHYTLLGGAGASVIAQALAELGKRRL